VAKPRGAGAPQGEMPGLLQVETLKCACAMASGLWFAKHRRGGAGKPVPRQEEGAPQRVKGQEGIGCRTSFTARSTERIPGGSKPLKPSWFAVPARVS
jgi:hypothetical protein